MCAGRVEAWWWGPVFPVPGHRVKCWGNRVIRQPVEVLADDGRRHKWTTPELPEAADFSRRVGRRVWDVSGTMTGWDLSRFTHASGTPRDTIRAQDPMARNIEIPNALIRQCFREKVRAARASG